MSAAQRPDDDQRAAARDIVAGASADLDAMPSPADPMGVARELLAADYRHGDAYTLRHWRGDWHRWTGPQWSPVEPAEITAWLYDRLDRVKYWHEGKAGAELRPWRPNKAKVAHVLDATGALTHLSGAVDPPAWVGKHGHDPGGRLIACANGLLDPTTRTLHGHTPAHFNAVSVPFAYDEQAPEPVRWSEFLASLWPDDPDAVAALQEWFGYVLSGRTEQHKIALLVGPPRSGKGTIARILTSLVGTGATANPTLASLAGNFGLAPLIGRTLGVIGDARLGRKADPSTVVERLLSISGEDALDVDRKFRDVWTGRLGTRFMILSNELPRLGDTSGAIASRFVVLNLTESYLGREDTTLGPALEVELPGILRWSLDGLDRLTARGAFTEPRSSADAVQALHDLVSPVSAFVRDCCEIGEFQVPVTDVWMAWQTWAGVNGHPVGSRHTLSRDVRAAVPALRTAQPRTEDGGRVRHFVGLRVRPEVARTNLRALPSLPQPPSAAEFMRGPS